MGKKGKKGKGVSGDAPVKTGKDQAEGGKLGEASPPEKELGEKNLDDFLNDWDNDESDGDGEGGDSEGEDSDGGEEEERDEEEEEGEDEEKEEQSKPAKNKSKTGAKDQKNYISKLKEKDPEFFEFLKENDQELLNFDESSDDDIDDEAEKKEKGKHKPPEKLEVASDESDFEDNDEDGQKEEKHSGGVEGSSKKLNQAQVDNWSTALTSNPTAALLTEVMAAFRGAVATVGAGGEESDEAKWKVEGGAMFNSVVRLAVVGLVPALRKVLKLEQGEVKLDKPEKSKQWKRIERPLRGYMLDLVALLGRVGEPSVLGVLLKHTHSMLPFYQVGLGCESKVGLICTLQAFAKGGKQLLNRLVSIWSRAEETPRILAFMCIVKVSP